MNSLLCSMCFSGRGKGGREAKALRQLSAVLAWSASILMCYVHVMEWGLPKPTNLGLELKGNMKATKCPFWIFLQPTFSFGVYQQNKTRLESCNSFSFQSHTPRADCAQGCQRPALAPSIRPLHSSNTYSSLLPEQQNQKSSTACLYRCITWLELPSNWNALEF